MGACTVHFNDKPRLPTVEIRDVGADLMLPPEGDIKLVSSQSLPKVGFWRRCLMPHRTGKIDMGRWNTRPFAVTRKLLHTSGRQNQMIYCQP